MHLVGSEDVIFLPKATVRNARTGRHPLLLHFNGGAKAAHCRFRQRVPGPHMGDVCDRLLQPNPNITNATLSVRTGDGGRLPVRDVCPTATRLDRCRFRRAYFQPVQPPQLSECGIPSQPAKKEGIGKGLGKGKGGDVARGQHSGGAGRPSPSPKRARRVKCITVFFCVLYLVLIPAVILACHSRYV